MKTYIVGLFVALSLIGPVHLFAESATVINANTISSYSEAELESLIAKLQARLAELKKGVACVITSKDLSLGDGDDETLRGDVKSLQNFLAEKGYFKVGATGYFGKITMASLIAFQKANGLSTHGELDAMTRAKIKSLSCKKAYYQEVKKEEKKEEKKTEKTSQVNSIKLLGEGASVKWVTDGYSKNGFKVVWSKNAEPKYPNRDGDKYQYFSDPNTNSTKLEAFNGSGTYYVRVCEYLGGACGVYSNQITLNL